MEPDDADAPPAVFVVDDDGSIRDALDTLLRSVGLRVMAFASIEAFRDSGWLGRPGCLLLDVRLTGRSGLSFQDELLAGGIDVPIVFMSAHADVPMAVGAMRKGAIGFLTKPVRPQELIDAVNEGLALDAGRRLARNRAARAVQAYSCLVEREREVMALVVAGHSSGAAATRLGLSEATVKVHRGRVMRKMGARTLAELVAMAQQLRETR